MSITKEQLQAIDALLWSEGVNPQEGRTPPWYTSVFTAGGVDELLALHGVRGVAAVKTLRSKSKYSRSRWLVIEDPEDSEKLRIVPELHLRATLLYGTLELTHVPFWDGEGRVQLTTKVNETSKDSKPNKYGFPPGTEGYRKAWYEANKEHVKEYQRQYAKRLRKDAKLLREAKKNVTKIEEKKTSSSSSRSAIEALAERLGIPAEILTEEKDVAVAGAATSQDTLMQDTPMLTPMLTPQCPRCGTDLQNAKCPWCNWPGEARAEID